MAGLTARIREKSGLSSSGTVEVHRWNPLRLFQGRVFVDQKEDALEMARGWTDREMARWTDGSRLESGGVGAAVAW